MKKELPVARCACGSGDVVACATCGSPICGSHRWGLGDAEGPYYCTAGCEELSGGTDDSQDFKTWREYAVFFIKHVHPALAFAFGLGAGLIIVQIYRLFWK